MRLKTRPRKNPIKPCVVLDRAPKSLAVMICVLAFFSLSLSLLPIALSQASTVATCLPYLLPLGSCVPFAQGRVPVPAQQCCINLKQIYNSQQGAPCLCPLLNASTWNVFPINSTLALQLPSLCSLQINTSLCSDPQETMMPPPSLPPIPPPIQVSIGMKNDSTSAAPPVDTVQSSTPPGVMVFGFQHRSGANSNVRDSWIAVLMAAWTSILWLYVLQ
ncbi:unnamed protein product [Cuscuta epithymum]|uniref:Bifunctional inhibitor/plant lipid transfer protein/seed storage helical domain-containing protein n=1 Tax=Cuscuta epithymum TaxID=186058 RepID=A0AAV0CU88_9ASTE|nr:unnamed protein product [Cuscuta epithymum]